MEIALRASQLKVISAVLTNVGSALLLAPFTVRDQTVLTVAVFFAIVSLVTAVRAEDALDGI